jgi:hypothetical protein
LGEFLVVRSRCRIPLGGPEAVRGRAKPFRGKIVSSILTLLSVSIFAVFLLCYFSCDETVASGCRIAKDRREGPGICFPDTHGNLVSLSTILSAPLDPSNPSRSAPKGALLIFYRGYW